MRRIATIAAAAALALTLTACDTADGDVVPCVTSTAVCHAVNATN